MNVHPKPIILPHFLRIGLVFFQMCIQILDCKLGKDVFLNRECKPYEEYGGKQTKIFPKIYQIQQNYIIFTSYPPPPPPLEGSGDKLFPLASIPLSDTKSCTLYNLKTVRGISTKLHTLVKHIQATCHAQEPELCFGFFGVISL